MRVEEAVQKINQENTVVTQDDVVTQIPPSGPTCCKHVFLVVDLTLVKIPF